MGVVNISVWHESDTSLSVILKQTNNIKYDPNVIVGSEKEQTKCLKIRMKSRKL